MTFRYITVKLWQNLRKLNERQMSKWARHKIYIREKYSGLIKYITDYLCKLLLVCTFISTNTEQLVLLVKSEESVIILGALYRTPETI